MTKCDLKLLARYAILPRIYMRLYIITMIKKATTIGIVPSQKISYSLNNFYINNYKFRS